MTRNNSSARSGSSVLLHLISKLAAKLTQKLVTSTQAFEWIIWQSLRNAPPIDKILFQLMAILSRQQQTEVADTIDAQISQLMAYLRATRCLLVFDNFESILAQQPAQSATRLQYSNFREGYIGYSELLRRIGTEHHTSCLLIITSREKPSTLMPLEGESAVVCTLDLHGLSAIEVAAIVLQTGYANGTTNGCHTTDSSDWQQLQQAYSGNPLAIKIAATTIRDLFDGSVSEFLAQGVILCDGIEVLLSQQFDRLCDIEQQVLYWLAIDREAVSISQLIADFIPSGSRSEVLGALQSLDRQSLIEKSAGCFTLQPVVMEYVTNKFIDRVCEEITTLDVDIFNSHALMQAQARDYIRESQVRMILVPLVDRLLGKLRSKLEIKNRLDRLLAKLRSEFADTCGYAGGNLINLYHHLAIDLSGYNFSGLCIWQAYLLNVDLHDINFADTNVAKSVFTETFGSIHSLAFSPDGNCLACGDFDGDIRLWDTRTYQLQSILKGHANWVQAVTYSPVDRLLASSSFDCTVKLWNLSTGECLKTFTEHTQGVYSVAFGYSNTLFSIALVPTPTPNPANSSVLVAGGYFDRLVRLWQIDTDEFTSFKGHTEAIRAIAVSPDGRCLAGGSGSVDPTIKLWSVQDGRCYCNLSGHTNEVWSVAFSADGRMLASGSNEPLSEGLRQRTIRIWHTQTGECLQVLQGHMHWVMSVVFSSPQILVSAGFDRTINFWDLQTGECLRTWQVGQSICAIAFNRSGDILASGSIERMVGLWDVATGTCSQTLSGHTHFVWSVAFSPDGRLLASGSFDRTIRLWDLDTGECLQVLEGHESGVFSVAFIDRASAPPGDRQLLASSSSVQPWDYLNPEFSKFSKFPLDSPDVAALIVAYKKRSSLQPTATNPVHLDRLRAIALKFHVIIWN